jgi:tRNA modification GTPase
LTPAGRGAIAFVLVSGPAATEIVDRLFGAAGGRPLHEQPLDRIVFGRWGGEELIVCRRGPQQVEVQCHGGSAAAEALIRSLAEQGVAIESWEEHVQQAAGDRLAAEAWQMLAQAQTERAALILLDQFHGALWREIEAICRMAAASPVTATLARVDALLARARIGRHLVRPFRVVLAGRPNVGKSSLVNRLLGYGRAITSPVPGTTRDIVTAMTALDGWAVELVDTAGLHEAGSELEQQGIERAAAEIRSADLVLLVHDASAASDGPSSVSSDAPLDAVIASSRSIGTLLEAWNKADLMLPAERTGPAERYVSAASGEGLDRLAAEIGRRLTGHPPEPGCGVPFIERHVQALERARDLLASGAGNAVAACLLSLIAGERPAPACQ